MIFPDAPSPVAKLSIAVVGAGVRPGQAPNEAGLRLLLQTAADSGVAHVATRPAGDEERLLGQAWPFPSPFRVDVLTISAAEGADRVEARARRSLERLGLPRGDVLLVSQAGDLAGAEGRALWDRLLTLKARGLYRRIGVRMQLEDAPALLARRLGPDVIQLPCNLLDQRAERSGLLCALAGLGVAVRIESPFAGGRLFAGGEGFAGDPALSRVRRRLAEARLDPMQAALAYALGRPDAEQVVASVASAAELRAMLAAAHAPTPNVDWTAFALDTADASAHRSVAAA